MVSTKNRWTPCRYQAELRRCVARTVTVNRNPIHAGRLHRYCGDPKLDQPIGHAFQVGGKRLEGLHRLFSNVGRHRHHMEARANVDASCAVMNDRQAITLRTRLFHEFPPMTVSAGRGLGSITFLNGVTKRATNNGSAASPGSGFLTGTQPPKSRRPLSSSVSVVGVFLIQWGAERRGGGFLGCLALQSRA